MHREYHRWYSPSLNRDMELLVFGHAGARILVFPTSQGRFYEWEDRGMIAGMGDLLDNGWIQLYCLDSVDSESWYAQWKHPEDRAHRNAQYDWYIVAEVLPLTRALNPNPVMITTGASFGAYHAANFAFRHPELVGRMIGLSGLYDIRRFTGGYDHGEVYFQNPVQYIANEHDSRRLAALGRMDIILVYGSDDYDWLQSSNQQLSAVLWSKGIWHALRVWNGWYHDWPFWLEMLRQYIAGSD